MSQYSSSLTTYIDGIGNWHDIELDLLHVKSGIAKGVLSRDLVMNYLDPKDRRHSLHYSHKRIRKPESRKSMPKFLLGKYLGMHYIRNLLYQETSSLWI